MLHYSYYTLVIKLIKRAGFSSFRLLKYIVTDTFKTWNVACEGDLLGKFHFWLWFPPRPTRISNFHDVMVGPGVPLAVVLLRCETLGGCACLGLCYATMPGIFQKNIRNQKTTWHAHGVTVWTLIWVYCLFDLILFEHVSGTLVSFYLKAPKISNCFDTAPKHWKNSPT